MDEHPCRRKPSERLRENNRELEPEQRLRARQNDTRLGEHVLYFYIERCARRLFDIAKSHQVFLLGFIPLS